MTDGETNHSDQITVPTSGLVRKLSRFEGSTEELLRNLLAVQCRLADADGAAILRPANEEQVDLVIVYPSVPQNAAAPAWLGHAAKATAPTVSSGSKALVPLHPPDALYDQPAREYLILLPLSEINIPNSVAGYIVHAPNQESATRAAEKLELSLPLLSLYETRIAAQQREIQFNHLRTAMEVTTAVNEHDHFKGAAMAFCNEVAARWDFCRVSVGFLSGKYVKAGAISHTEKFTRKMKLVQDIEASMEECLDQDIEIFFPAPETATYVSRITKELAVRSGRSSIISLPLRRDGKPVGVVTAEKEDGQTPGPTEIESLRLTAELCTPRLANLHEHDKWFGARAASSSRKALAVVLGAKYTWIKLIAVIVTCVILFACFVKGDYEVSAPFVVEPVNQRVVSAPFDEVIESVLVRPGDSVVEDETVLARLDTSELQSRLESEKAKYESYDKQANLAMGSGKTANAHIARQQANSVLAQIKLLEQNIREANIVSPVTGYVLKGIRPRQTGATVKRGDVLFEIAPIELLQAELFVSEKEIADVRPGQKGTLTSNSYPGKYIDFVVEQITPAAEIRDNNNVFRVRVAFQESLENLNWMKPNIEGTAKINIREERYVWIWTHKLVDWIRMKLWW